MFTGGWGPILGCEWESPQTTCREPAATSLDCSGEVSRPTCCPVSEPGCSCGQFLVLTEQSPHSELAWPSPSATGAPQLLPSPGQAWPHLRPLLGQGTYLAKRAPSFNLLVHFFLKE